MDRPTTPIKTEEAWNGSWPVAAADAIKMYRGTGIVLALSTRWDCVVIMQFWSLYTRGKSSIPSKDGLQVCLTW